MRNITLIFIFFVSTMAVSPGCEDENILAELSDNNEVKVFQALDRLKDSGDEQQESIPALIQIINTTESMGLKKKAIKTFGAVSKNDNCLALRSFLRDKNPEIVKISIIAVAQCDYAPLAEDIRPFLSDPEMRNYAIWCLGQLGETEDVSRIVPFLNSNGDTGFIAYKALFMF